MYLFFLIGSVANTPSPVRERPTRKGRAPLSFGLLFLFGLEAGISEEDRWIPVCPLARASACGQRDARQCAACLHSFSGEAIITSARRCPAAATRAASWRPRVSA